MRSGGRGDPDTCAAVGHLRPYLLSPISYLLSPISYLLSPIAYLPCSFAPYPLLHGTIAVASISTFARGSTSRLTSTAVIAG